ncbi:MAG: hypothetical protein IT328_13805 [Caldilineaceae bacterium]|nr:hypothetical protein [Caldilineaceae bacterium]
MNLRNKWTMGVVGLSAVLVLGVSAGTVYAQTATPDQAPVLGVQRFGKDVDHNALLAEALGISVEELQAAQTEARAAVIDEAVAEGRITQEQAEQMKQRDVGRGWGRLDGDSDHTALLAEALGISVEKLQAAQDEVRSNLIAEAVAAGEMTQEEADLMQARQALQEYLRDRMQTAYEQAVQQAVTDGVLTQAQADQILSQDGPFGGRGFFGGPGFFGGRGMRPGMDGGRHGGHRGGPFGGPGGIPNEAPAEPDQSTPESSSGTVAPLSNANL